MPNNFNAQTIGVTAIDPDGDGVEELVNFGTFLFFGIADFRGDGRQVALISGNPAVVRRKVNGVWTSEPTSINCSQMCYLADVNGDGATDLVRMVGGWDGSTGRPISNNHIMYVHLWTGREFQEVISNVASFPLAGVRDLDNDGKADTLRYPAVSGSNALKSMQMSALQFNAAGAQFVHDGRTMEGPYGTADLKGDGIPDFRDGNRFRTSSVGTGNPNLLRSVVLETGGVVKVEYGPSSSFAPTFMPQVMHAVTKLTLEDDLQSCCGFGTVACRSSGRHDRRNDKRCRVPSRERRARCIGGSFSVLAAHRLGLSPSLWQVIALSIVVAIATGFLI